MEGLQGILEDTGKSLARPLAGVRATCGALGGLQGSLKSTREPFEASSRLQQGALGAPKGAIGGSEGSQDAPECTGRPPGCTGKLVADARVHWECWEACRGHWSTAWGTERDCRKHWGGLQGLQGVLEDTARPCQSSRRSEESAAGPQEPSRLHEVAKKATNIPACIRNKLTSRT